MLSIGRLFGLIVLFLFFEVVVWVLGTFLLPDVNPLMVCAALTGLALLVWVVYVFTTRWAARPHAAVPAPAAPALKTIAAVLPGPEANDLKSLIREAENRLAASPEFSRKGAKPSLLKLPIYLIAGPSGSGKTSSFANSGLDPRLLAGESYRDTVVVPTRLCNIWYADDAIWIDVSGKVFEDETGWRGLLNILTGREKKSFWRRFWEGNATGQNIRGAVLFCDANVFLHSPDPQQVSALSRRLQDRLEAVSQVVGAEFPVYTVLSKADTFPYFGEFFNQLSEQEDRQILGFTLPAGAAAVRNLGEVYTEAENKRLSEYWTRLYQSLCDKRLTFLGREPSPNKKPFIYEFPREVKRVRAEVVRFLVDTFRPNPLHPGAHLRGLYLGGIRKVAASSRRSDSLEDQTQSKMGAATVMFKASDLRQAMASASLGPAPVPNEVTTSRWIFLSDVFHRVVLADRSLVASVKSDPLTDRYRLLAFGSLALLGLLLAIGFTTSWVNNRQLLESVQTAISRPNSTASGDLLSLDNLQTMDAMQNQLALLTDYERNGRPWKLRWGLYSGDQLRTTLRSVYFARFEQAFLDPILASLQGRFSRLQGNSPSESYGAVYDGLKVYRTVTSGACKPDQVLLSQALPTFAMAGRPVDAMTDPLARRQINFYISELLAADPYDHKLKEDKDAGSRAQEYLRGLKGPEQFYRGLIADVNASKPDVKLATYAPEYAAVLTGPDAVAGSFTRQGWETVQQKIRDGRFASIGDCVVGNQAAAVLSEAGSAGRDIQNLYVKDYIKTWREFLSRQGISHYQDLADASRKLDLLSQYRSPLLGALLMIADNTKFPPAQAGLEVRAAEAAKESLTAKVTSYLSRSKKAQSVVKDALASPAALSQNDVNNVFQPLLSVVSPDTKDKLVSPLNQSYITALAELKVALDALPRDRNATPDNALIEAARRARDKAYDVVRQLATGFQFAKAQGTDQDLIRYLKLPIDSADRLIPAPVDPSAKVNGQLKPVCEVLGRVQRKYPFSPGSANEVTISELTKLFEPQRGLISSFQNIPQMPGLLIQGADHQWVQNPAIQQPKLTPEFLQFFNRGARISDALYPAGAASPHLQFTVEPMATEGVQSLNVTMNGVTSSIGHPVPFFWPSASGSTAIELHLTLNGIGRGFYEGTWAIMRLVDDAEPRRPQANEYLFRHLRQGHGGLQDLTGADGQPITIHLMINFAGGFDLRNLSIPCPRAAAQ